MKTATELATAVLRHLAVVDASETPDSADLTYVEGIYDDKWAELSAYGSEYTYWPSAEIPDAVFLILRDLISLEVRGAFGQPVSAQEREVEEAYILKRLKRHVQIPTDKLPNKAVYY